MPTSLSLKCLTCFSNFENQTSSQSKNAINSPFDFSIALFRAKPKGEMI